MFRHKYIDDILSRAVKTFVQAFCGILIPEIVSILQNGFPESDKLWYILFPILCSSFAAGISATWNLINNTLLKEEEEDEEDGRNNQS